MKIHLLKLFDVSILPAILAVCAKLFGVFIASFLFDITWSALGSSFFPSVRYPDTVTLMYANSFSQICMGLVLVLGSGVILMLAHHFHETHIHPRRAAKLESNGLAFFIVSSFDIYHRALIWLSLLWMVALVSLYEAYLGLEFIWVSIVLLTISATFTFVFAADIDKEGSITD